MNDAPERPAGSPLEANAQLARLNRQVSAMRAVLVQLLQDVVVAEAQLDQSQASLLVQANEQLVVSAMGALQEADTAHGALDEATRVNGLDDLTGLPNRTVLLDRFELAIANARRHGKRVALLFVDLDDFKQINDTHGHAAGDRALQLVASGLSSLVRESDTVSRHGGDEFLMLLAEVTSAADANRVADKVNAALASFSRFDGQPWRLKASIGISIYPEDGEDARTLIAHADAAMYLVKKQAQEGNAPDTDPTPAAAKGQVRESRQPPRLAKTAAALLEQTQTTFDLRDANENLILAALGAQELLAAAEEVRRRQAELLSLVADELSNPYAPIRLAASALGISGAGATLLPRVQRVIEEQAEKLAGMVRQALGQPGQDGAGPGKPPA